MKKPKISIVIANYNNGFFFPDCYNSLVNQTSRDWEAIVLDDCSTDNSEDIILRLIKDDPRFHFHRNEKNIGYQRTLLKGIALSRSSIFARLDPDDALALHAIQVSLKAHEDHPEAGLVYSNFVFCNEELHPREVHQGQQITDLDNKYLNFLGEISHFASFKKNFYDLTTGIDPFIKRAEDKDIYMKMCEVAPVKYIDEDIYLYRVHQRGVSGGDNQEKALFWHWVAIIKMAQRRGIDIEDLFVENYVPRSVMENKLNRIKRSKWAKLGAKLGLFKAYRNI
ncbi:glycosyltransferase family 2 protein [Sphingobacterium sp. DN00404]|uniref:Glycosyltransferase family 2 protein n=1 Tax=Sphingobacterium micropteri TaxID=2763501 RepID=A0ABR7YRB0_9SPHI|nr:glycosyltransferase family A protein [Sphingobacterium micropteri]MBD1433819.1 glycosyltransferase family 2 protein [Sphingobacterium micropteri]